MTFPAPPQASRCNCVAQGIYCILDWHVHHPGDPGFYLTDSKAFFEKMATRYASLPNLLYEIAHESNRTGLAGVAEEQESRWADIVAYANEARLPVFATE